MTHTSGKINIRAAKGNIDKLTETEKGRKTQQLEKSHRSQRKRHDTAKKDSHINRDPLFCIYNQGAQ